MFKPNKDIVDLFKRAKTLVYKFDEEVKREVYDDDYTGIFQTDNWAPIFDEKVKAFSLDESLYVNAQGLFQKVLLKLLETEFTTLEVKLHWWGPGWGIVYDGFLYDIGSVEKIHDAQVNVVSVNQWLEGMSFREKEVYKLILKELKA